MVSVVTALSPEMDGAKGESTLARTTETSMDFASMYEALSKDMKKIDVKLYHVVNQNDGTAELGDTITKTRVSLEALELTATASKQQDNKENIVSKPSSQAGQISLVKNLTVLFNLKKSRALHSAIPCRLRQVSFPLQSLRVNLSFLCACNILGRFYQYGGPADGKSCRSHQSAARHSPSRI